MGIQKRINIRQMLVQGMPESVYALRDAGLRVAQGRRHQAFPFSKGECRAPFSLLGSGRSGSTLLRRMLSVSASVYIPEETYFLRDLVKQARSGVYHDWPSYVDSMLNVMGRHAACVQESAFADDLRDRCLNIGPEKRSLATIIDAFYRASASAAGLGESRWGDKTPMYTYSTEVILALFPAAQFVHVLRDGIDVCASCVQSGLMATPTEAAYRWLSSVRRMRKFQDRHPNQATVVRYEDLVTKPDRELMRLCRFLSIEFVPSMAYSLDVVPRMGDVNRLAHHANVQAPVSAAGIGKGRRTLPMRERARLGLLLDRELRRWGYPPAREEGGA